MTFASIEGETARLPDPSLSPEKRHRFAARFPAKLREPVRILAGSDPRLAQAMRVFPGVMAELARMPAASLAAMEITRLIREGAPLKDVGRAAGLPLWMRRLPPEAFERSVPNGIATLLPGAAIANHLPRSPKQAARWLGAVIEAAQVCDGDFAVWLARGHRDWPRTGFPTKIRTVGVYAWYAKRCPRRPKIVPHAARTEAQSFTSAYDAALRWFELLDLRLTLAGNEPTPWLGHRRWGDYDFVPLVTAAEIDAEAKAMENCLVTYGHRVRSGRFQLWSIRQNGNRLATMAIGGYRDYPLLSIGQLAGFRNKPVPSHIWLAAEAWLSSHADSDRLQRSSKPRFDDFDRAAWVAMWRPYWLSKRRIPAWLPLRPSRSALTDLRGGND